MQYRVNPGWTREQDRSEPSGEFIRLHTYTIGFTTMKSHVARLKRLIEFVRFQVVLSYSFLDDFRATTFSAMILGWRLALNNQDLCDLVKIS